MAKIREFFRGVVREIILRKVYLGGGSECIYKVINFNICGSQLSPDKLHAHPHIVYFILVFLGQS